MRAGRPERRGQDHAAATAVRAGPANRGRDLGAGRHAPPGPGLAGRNRFPGPGDPALPAVHRRGAHQHRRAPEPALGRGAGARPADAPENPAGPAGAPGRPGGGPRAALAPLARRPFLATMADAVAGDGLTVLLSSHLVADMERVVDYLILLSASHVQLSGDIDALLAEHRVLVGPRKDTAAIARTHTIVQAVHTARQTTLLVRGTAPVIDPAWEGSDVGLEEMVLAYMGQDAAPAISRLTPVGEEQ